MQINRIWSMPNKDTFSIKPISESYKKLGKSVNMQTTQSSYWSNLKKEIKRVLTPSGVCISFGWNSGGIGASLGFDIEEILIVPHGGWHNDTIFTVDRKAYHQHDLQL